MVNVWLWLISKLLVPHVLPVEQLELFVKLLISFQFLVEDSLVKDLQMEDVSPNTPFGQDEFSPRQVSFTQF